MAQPELLLVRILHTLVYIALLALAGQGVVGLLAGARRQTNPIYALFQIVTKPAVRATRWITPKIILDRHVPFVTFFLLVWLLLFLGWARRFLAS